MKKKIQMLEIGVQSGGSTRVWSQYFGENLNYTGLDINPNCTQFEMPEKGIHILTGSQMDEQLLQRICRDYGPFDIIIDDGGHTSEMIMRSFNILFGCMHDGGVYAMEDLHSMVWFAAASLPFQMHSLLFSTLLYPTQLLHLFLLLVQTKLNMYTRK